MQKNVSRKCGVQFSNFFFHLILCWRKAKTFFLVYIFTRKSLIFRKYTVITKWMGGEMYENCVSFRQLKWSTCNFYFFVRLKTVTFNDFFESGKEIEIEIETVRVTTGGVLNPYQIYFIQEFFLQNAIYLQLASQTNIKHPIQPRRKMLHISLISSKVAV